MGTTTQGDFLNACDKLLATAGDVVGQPTVEELLPLLGQDVLGARDAQARRNVSKAAAQQASRDLDAYLASARRGYSRLKAVLQGVFGKDAEKMVEFGFQPFRPSLLLPKKPPVEEMREGEKMEKPPENGQSPTQAAHSQTDSAS